jgi:putative transposase
MGRNRVVFLLMVFGYNGFVKLTLQTQLVPDNAQTKALRETVERFNEAANWVAGELFLKGVTNKRVAQQLVYRELRDRFALTAQTAILVIHRVCEAYKRDKSIRPSFKKHAAITYDPRVMKFIGLDKVNLWTLAGRLTIPILIGAYQAERIGNAKGQCDLVLRKDGKWFLIITIDIPDGTPIPVTDFLGVDLGIAKIATDSDGKSYSGKPVEVVRRKHNLQRKRLGKRNTKGAKKKLKRIAGKEARFRKYENHCISKAIVATAKGTGRGIACEDLTHIRDRLPVWGRDARNKLSGWSFAQLFAFVSYKARLVGVPVVTVDPRNTSRTCAECQHCEKDNRKSQEKFLCVGCGHRANADVNAALNLRALAVSKPAIELVSLRA